MLLGLVGALAHWVVWMLFDLAVTLRENIFYILLLRQTHLHVVWGTTIESGSKMVSRRAHATNALVLPSIELLLRLLQTFTKSS